MNHIFFAVALIACSGVAIADVGRKVVVDDAPTFGSGKYVRGISWNPTSPRGGLSTPPAFDISGNGSIAQPTTFSLRFGAVTVAAGQSALVTEDGQLYFGDSSLALTGRGLVSLFDGKNLFASTPGQYTASVGIGGTFFGHSLGEYVGASGDLLLQTTTLTSSDGRVIPIYSETDLAPDGAGRISRFTWFGMTSAPDACSTSTLLDIYNNPATYGNSFAGTTCATHLTTPRYFGQVTLVDIGSREDGDFDLFLDYGTPHIFSLNNSTLEGSFLPAPTLFGEVNPTFNASSQRAAATVFANTVGPSSTSGFLLGNQKFDFGNYDASSSPNQFRFRGGIACAVVYDAAGGEVGCDRVTQLSDSNDVPVPTVAMLFLIGGFGFARAKIGKAA